jgi:hypothetical protein
MTSKVNSTTQERDLLEKVGLATADVGAWLATLPELGNDFSVDTSRRLLAVDVLREVFRSERLQGRAETRSDLTFLRE